MDGKVAVLLLFALGSVCGQEATAKLNVVLSPAASLREGENLEIQCRTNDKALSGGKFIQWIKELPNPEDESKPQFFLMGANRLMYDPFKKYIATFREEGDDVIFLLKITNVTIEDTGKLGCQIDGNKDLKDVQDFTVLVPPSEVSLKVDGKPAGEEVELTEDSPVSVTCTVRGSNPQPQVKISIGSDNVTNNFDQNHKKSMIPVHHPTNKTGLVKVTNEMVLENTNFQPKSAYVAKKLTCSASVSNLPPVTASFKIKMSAKPHFECPNVVYAYDGQASLKIHCTVISDPPVNTVAWSFERTVKDGNDSVVYLEVGKKFGQMEVKKLVSGDTDLHKIATLEIIRVRAQHFRIYKISAENDLGEQSKDITLTEKAREGYSVDGAVGCSYVQTMLLTCLMLITSWLCL